MIKTLDKKNDDFETSTGHSRRFIADTGSPDGYEERLYQSMKGDFFLDAPGGTASNVDISSYSTWTSDSTASARVTALANHDAEAWAREHLDKNSDQEKAEGRSAKKREKMYGK